MIVIGKISYFWSCYINSMITQFHVFEQKGYSLILIFSIYLPVERGSSWKSRHEDIACLSYHVKFIQISSLNGEEIALELLKFLLQNGKVLEKLEIPHMSAQMKRINFGNVESLTMASLRVVLSFPKLCQGIIPWFDKGDSDPEYDDDDDNDEN